MRHLYNSRVAIIRLALTMTDGLPQQSWQQIPDIVDPFLGQPGEMMCRLDLIFQRPGKDQPMPIVAGRAPDRVGIMFFDPTDKILSGDRFQVLEGPTQGVFEIRTMPDVAQSMIAHHMEVQVIEVAQNFQPYLLDTVGDATP